MAKREDVVKKEQIGFLYSLVIYAVFIYWALLQR